MCIGEKGMRKRGPTTDFQIAHYGDDHSANQQQNGLYAFGPHHRQQSTNHRINPGEQTENHDEQQQRIDSKNCCTGREPQDSAQYPCRGVQRHSHMNDNGRKERDHRQHVAATTIETPLEKIRQGCNSRTQVQRRKE